MARHAFRWLVTSVAIFIVPHLITGVHVDSVGTALAVALVLGLLNVVLRPLLILITLPLTLFSFGLFLLFINAFLFELAGSFVSGFRVDSFGSAFLASLFVTILSWFLGGLFSGPRVQIAVGGNWRKPKPRDPNTIDLQEDGKGNWK